MNSGFSFSAAFFCAFMVEPSIRYSVTWGFSFCNSGNARVLEGPLAVSDGECSYFQKVIIIYKEKNERFLLLKMNVFMLPSSKKDFKRFGTTWVFISSICRCAACSLLPEIIWRKDRPCAWMRATAFLWVSAASCRAWGRTREEMKAVSSCWFPLKSKRGVCVHVHVLMHVCMYFPRNSHVIHFPGICMENL